MPGAMDATYYRTGLLLGLIRGDEVHRWAERVIAEAPVAPPALLEVVSTRADDLSALRQALWPLVIEPDPPAVVRAMFALLHRDLAAGRRGLPDTISVLRQMRGMMRLPPDLYEALNAVFVEHTTDAMAIPRWLTGFAMDDL